MVSSLPTSNAYTYKNPYFHPQFTSSWKIIDKGENTKMLAKEADTLKRGDKVITRNGPYTQNAIVISVRKDHRNVRWISYWWTAPRGQKLSYEKRHNSVYLPEEKNNDKQNPDGHIKKNN